MATMVKVSIDERVVRVGWASGMASIYTMDNAECLSIFRHKMASSSPKTGQSEQGQVG